jgi:hypothetical protein
MLNLLGSHPELLPTLALLYFWSDRWIGGGFGWKKLGHAYGGPLRAGPAPYAALLLLPVSWLIGLPAVIVAISWLIYRRGFGWKWFGHTALNPEVRDMPVALWRHNVATVVLIAFHYLSQVWPWSPLDLQLQIVAAFGFSFIAGWLARLNNEGDLQNSDVEMLRGAAFGFTMAVSLIFG